MQIYRAWLGLLAFGPVIAGCEVDTVEPTEELRLESARFVFLSCEEHATIAEMEAGVQRAEVLFARMAEIVGSANTPIAKINVHLDGDHASGGRPHVDFDGIHLFRYSEDEGGYWALLAHELGHAFGIPWFVRMEAWNWPTYRFFDEGFAEFMAQSTNPHKRGFPFYGFPEDAAAGQWVVRDEHVPMDVLRVRHADLNRPCEIQAYPQRASWMRYVDEVYGRDALLSIVYPPTEPTSDVVQELVGVGLEQLDQEWQEWITAQYASLPRADQIAQAYRERTSWAHVCRAGVDY
jgi:hypothetical protein